MLLIDDEVLFLENLAKVLNKRGITVHMAQDSQRGLDLLGRVKPQVVILDLQMPGIGGMETLRRLKEQDPITPVIILTGKGSAESGIETLRLEAFDFHSKPVSVRKLMDTIEEAIRFRDLAEEISRRKG